MATSAAGDGGESSVGNMRFHQDLMKAVERITKAEGSDPMLLQPQTRSIRIPEGP